MSDKLGRRTPREYWREWWMAVDALFLFHTSVESYHVLGYRDQLGKGAMDVLHQAARDKQPPEVAWARLSEYLKAQGWTPKTSEPPA